MLLADATVNSLYVLAASAIAGFLTLMVAAGTFVLYVRERRGSEKDDARDEALALSNTRGKRIDDLTQEVERLRKARAADRELHDAQIRGLREEMTELDKRFSSAQRDFSAAQALTARAVVDLVVRVTDYLEETPPDVDAALELLRAYTSGRTPEADTRRT